MNASVANVGDELVWEALPRLPRTARRRAKRADVWEGVELMASGAGVMGDWEWAFGSALGVMRQFLRPTGRRATTIACPAEPACGCRHAVRETERLGLVAACCCEHWQCETFRLEPEDVAIHSLHRRAFGGAVAPALGFLPAEGNSYETTGLIEVGRCQSLAAPVYLGFCDGDALVREMQRVVNLREGPFLLLTPTGKCCNPQVEQALRYYGAAHISLSSVLDVSNGQAGMQVFRAKQSAEQVLADFSARIARWRQSGAVLSSIHREISSVRGEFVELRSAKQQLEKMVADRLFAFTSKVDATSFKVFCTILSEGDIAKASRTLKMPEATLRATVRRWRDKGPEFLKMQEFVRWRKKAGRKEKVPLNDAIIHERAQSADYPALLSDVLDGLLSMTDGNWAELCEELAQMLRPVVART